MGISSSNEPKLYIRADGGSRIGTGHIMRCLALARAWQKISQGKVIFLSYLEGKDLRQKIVDRGFEVLDVPKPYPYPDDVKQIVDLQAKENAGSKSWLVVDGYHFDSNYLAAMQAAGYRVLLIDDLAQDKTVQADMVLNQNMYARKEQYHCDVETDLLLGSHYVLLREEFLRAKSREPHVARQAKRVLVTLGGGDFENVTLKVLLAIGELNQQDLEIKVVAGPANKYFAALEKAAKKMSCNCEVLTGVEDMPACMLWADLVISAGGSSCWESVYLGVPFTVIILADNQVRVAESLDATGCAVNQGWHHRLQTIDLANRLSDLFDDQEARQSMVMKGQRLIDGQGAERVAKRMLTKEIAFRPVVLDDWELLLDWANDPVTRKNSFQTAAISTEEHKKWLAAKLKDPSCLMLLAMTGAGEPFGQVRFDDMDGNDTVISVSISREYRGLGLGCRMIQGACVLFMKEKGDGRIKALVKQNNESSRKAFSGAGFRLVAEEYINEIPTIIMQYQTAINERVQCA